MSSEEVNRLITSMRPKSSPTNFIPTSVLKCHSDAFAPIIVNLANLSFSSGRFPSLFRVAQVSHLPKKQNIDESDPANYWPMFNLNTISKIIERLALERMYWTRQILTLCNRYIVLYIAPRRRSSTSWTTCFAPPVARDRRCAWSNGCVWHHQPLAFIGSTFIWFRNHRLCTSLGGVVLYPKELNTSRLVRKYLKWQGYTLRCRRDRFSVLSCLHRTSYILPVGRLINSFGIKHQQYADNTTLYNILDLSDPSCIDNLQAYTQAVNVWFLANNMQLN